MAKTAAALHQGFSIKIIQILVISGLLADRSIALQCFSCGVTNDETKTNTHNDVIPICSKFDGSSRFVVECPFSTMCLRTVHTMYLKHGIKQQTTTLSCAQQKYTEYKLENKNWVPNDFVKEVYPEGCIVEPNDLLASTKMSCYCRGHLCNFANRPTMEAKTKTFVFLIIIILLKNYF
ncbi:uncharacterized protein LOC131995358 [Stomoxys calcitrans]|uniref:uncharacterized protein LOC131995358 n=1 Tax=Stomoxys calcitrans TaxID=35570 RepID=UPI0027E337CA|nr:uncharacterized protein LOC131995358 [Stomoxys calcitrans]